MQTVAPTEVQGGGEGGWNPFHEFLLQQGIPKLFRVK